MKITIEWLLNTTTP